MSYGMDGYLYIMRGYGTMPTGGYSIRVDSLAETSDEIFFILHWWDRRHLNLSIK